MSSPAAGLQSGLGDFGQWRQAQSRMIELKAVVVPIRMYVPWLPCVYNEKWDLLSCVSPYGEYMRESSTYAAATDHGVVA